MEDNVVFSDEVHESCFRVFPPFLPAVGQQFFCIRDISYGRVEPHVEHLSLCSLHGNGDTPVEVACHGARLQVEVEPALALSVHVGTPLLVPLEYPFLKPVLIFVERQIPVFRLFQHRL